MGDVIDTRPTGSDEVPPEVQQQLQEKMEELAEAPPPKMVPIEQLYAALLPRRAGSLLFFLSGGSEIGIHLDRVMWVCDSGEEGAGAVIRYDMEHDGRNVVEIATNHTVSAIREAMQK